MTVWLLLGVAGLSETAGRILPLLARRHRASRASVIRLLLVGTVVEAIVFASWPLTAWTVASLIAHGPPAGAAPSWTVNAVAPLLLTGILAFPLFGPALHLAMLVLAGVALAGDLAVAARLDWRLALVCVAGSMLLLATLVAAVRRFVGAWGSVQQRVWTT